MSSRPLFAGVAVGVSKPTDFVRSGHAYRFGEIPQAASDVEVLRSRLQTLALGAGHPLVIEAISGLDASRDAILGALDRQLTVLAPGGLLIFILEGHGTDVPDVDGDEKRLGHEFDQAFPTADLPIIDDDLWSRWSTRPDLTIFTIADTCRAESITTNIMFDAYRQNGVLLTRRQDDIPLIHQLVTTSGPSILQFAASRRGTDADDVLYDEGFTGRFTHAILEASRNPANLATYRAWFTAANALVRSESEQTPVLYYHGPDPALIDTRPGILAAVLA